MREVGLNKPAGHIRSFFAYQEIHKIQVSIPDSFCFYFIFLNRPSCHV